MIELDDRKILDDGTVLCTDDAIMEILYSGKSIKSIVAYPSEDMAMYNKTDKLLDTGFGEIRTSKDPIYENSDWFSSWFTPEPYSSLDVEEFCISRCQDQSEIERTKEELILYQKYNLIPVLRHLIYMVDIWREKNIVWGVGRGSSVSSFVLHLIGINRINPMQWGLQINEFLK